MWEGAASLAPAEHLLIKYLRSMPAALYLQVFQTLLFYHSVLILALYSWPVAEAGRAALTWKGFHMFQQ